MVTYEVQLTRTKDAREALSGTFDHVILRGPLSGSELQRWLDRARSRYSFTWNGESYFVTSMVATQHNPHPAAYDILEKGTLLASGGNFCIMQHENSVYTLVYDNKFATDDNAHAGWKIQHVEQIKKESKPVTFADLKGLFAADSFFGRTDEQT